MEVAKALVAGGLGKGERVGVLMTNRAEFLSAVFGSAMAGGVAVPLSTFSTPNELDYLLAGSGCSVLLLEPHVHKKDFSADPVRPRAGNRHDIRRAGWHRSDSPSCVIWPWWTAMHRRGRSKAGAPSAHAVPRSRRCWLQARAATVTPADPAALFFSSGSTSKPKGILSAHRGVAIQLWRMRRQQGLGDDVRSWTANGFFWSGNFAMVIGGTLCGRRYAGASADLSARGSTRSDGFAKESAFPVCVASPMGAARSGRELECSRFVGADICRCRLSPRAASDGCLLLDRTPTLLRQYRNLYAEHRLSGEHLAARMRATAMD